MYFYWAPKQYQLCFLDDMGKPYFSYDVQYLIALLLVPTTLWHFWKLEKRSRSYNFMRFFLTIQFVWAKNSVQWLGLPGSLPSGSHHPDLYFFLFWELCKPSFATGILGGEATQATAKLSTNWLLFWGVLSSRMLVSWWSGPSWIWNYINSGRGRFAYNTALAI